MKAIVIYCSKTGFTKKYAEWLAESLECKSISSKECKSADISDCDLVIYGGGLHAGMMNGVKWFKEQIPLLQGQRKIVFMVGAAPGEAVQISKLADQNFTKEQQSQIQIFYLYGGLCYEKMGLADKLMMKAVGKMMSKKKNKTPAEDGMARGITQSFDSTDRRFLEPIITFVKGDV